MKYLLLFLIFPLCAFGQPALLPLRTALPSGSERIDLPEMKSESSFDGDRYHVTDRAQYVSLFPDSTRLPAIDFARYELLSIAACAQCISLCGDRAPCHRNACSYSRAWYKVPKTALQPVTPDNFFTAHCAARTDTVISGDSAYAVLKACKDIPDFSPDFSNNVVITRREFGDCHATFRHTFFLDTVNHCLVWRLYETYGGCRGGSLRMFVASVPKLPEGYRVVFEEYATSTRD